MFKGIVRAVRFGRGWKGGASRVQESEVEIEGEDGTFPATLLLPEGRTGPLPGWVTLHGITRPGRNHPTLHRFVRALAASGAVVLVPEIPEWREMRLHSRKATTTLRSSVLALAGREETASAPLGVMGFSFGGPQALLAGADPVLLPHLGVVVSFGGYCDMARTLRFLFTGAHEWGGERFRADPDPYGRWVVGGNYLPSAVGFQGTEDVAAALLSLASYAGDVQVGSWESLLDARKSELEQALPPSRRELFRAFAPDTGAPIPREAVDALVPALAEAAGRSAPLFDVAPHLPGIAVPVRLIHGRQDRLIPFTEALRLAGEFPSGADVRVFLTGLFSHSRREGGRERVREALELLRFLRLMSVVLGSL